MKRRELRRLTIVALAFLLFSPLVLAAQIKLSNDVAWVKSADAYKGCVEQAYAGAQKRIQELATAEKPGTWCVVLDLDETLISNVQFQVELQAAGEEYSSAAWDAWCGRGQATSLPGAKEFCARVRELGGKVIIITNRQGPVKYGTVKNVDELGIPYDALLVREGPYALDRSKSMRRGDVEKGMIKTLPPEKKPGPLKILMLVGDQTHDLYDDKSLGFAEVKDRFAQDLVILPNPMYGDWASPGVFVEGKAGSGAAAGLSPGAITWQEAMNKMGESVVVEAKVVKVYDPETRGKGGPVKLNVDYDYRNSLTFVYYKKDRAGNDQGYPHPDRFLNKTVRVRGQVSEYQGSKQIMLKSASDIEILD